MKSPAAAGIVVHFGLSASEVCPSWQAGRACRGLCQPQQPPRGVNATLAVAVGTWLSLGILLPTLSRTHCLLLPGFHCGAGGRQEVPAFQHCPGGLHPPALQCHACLQVRTRWPWRREGWGWDGRHGEGRGRSVWSTWQAAWHGSAAALKAAQLRPGSLPSPGHTCPHPAGS